ncbi:hypothetical protein QR680_002658 [Steinernema hermaphroditum]|uniref:sphingolipid 4-desaturase n=1 Tax=Steinernema hermaphroditum TaxID=289476 RepID=A0AA39H4H0_9BILA|nr:hypothetical protein QR680_002658 [Steinernema hermaphroditum]
MGQQVTKTSFDWTYTEEPHRTRRKQMLDKYPEIKETFGIDPSFKYVVVMMVVLQIFLAYLVRDADWTLVWLQAYFSSGTINHSLTLAVHEISHNIAFGTGRPLANRLFGFVANLPTGLPMSISFKKYHIEHHRFMGEVILDTDAPTEFEAKWFTTTFGKFVWTLLQPIFAFRPFVTYPKATTDLEIVNIVIEVVFDVGIYLFLGPKSLFYLMGGFLVGIGLHPLAGHYISDHYVFMPNQETYSYYGLINLVNFNAGYHVEHHDFPYVCGRNLPKISKIAPEFYEGLMSHDSWPKIIYRFVTDPAVSLRSRIKRNISDESEIQFFDTGAYGSCHVHKAIETMIRRLTGSGKESSKNS